MLHSGVDCSKKWMQVTKVCGKQEEIDPCMFLCFHRPHCLCVCLLMGMYDYVNSRYTYSSLAHVCVRLYVCFKLRRKRQCVFLDIFLLYMYTSKYGYLLVSSLISFFCWHYFGRLCCLGHHWVSVIGYLQKNLCLLHKQGI